MTEFLTSSIYFGFSLTILYFIISQWIYKKTKFFLFSPLLVTTALCIATLIIFNVPYKVESDGKITGGYMLGASMIHHMLTPVTVCLAIPLYRQFEKLKQNWLAVLLGILSGIFTNAVVILVMCIFLKIGHREYVSLLPKSITTAIALGVTNEYNGLAAITVLMVTIAGNIGNLFASSLCSLFHITDKIATGVAIGTSSHALGTARALELGEIEGAMSGLSIAVCGLLTVIILPFFVTLL